jgi:2-methylaconitate isomerase
MTNHSSHQGQSTQSVPVVVTIASGKTGLLCLATDLPRGPRERDLILSHYVASDGPFKHATLILMSASLRDDCTYELLMGEYQSVTRVIDWHCFDAGWVAAAAIAIASEFTSITPGALPLVFHLPALGMNASPSVSMAEGVADISLKPVRQTMRSTAPLLPTGQVKQPVEIGSATSTRPYLVSVVHHGSPVLIVRVDHNEFDAVHLSRATKPETERRRKKQLAKLYVLRDACAELLTDFSQIELERDLTLVWVSSPTSFIDVNGIEHEAFDADVMIGALRQGQILESPTDTVLFALGAAAALPGSVVNEISRTLPGVHTRVAHRAGIDAISAEVRQTANAWVADSFRLTRRAFCVMRGQLLQKNPVIVTLK